ncbi:hypothetical protein NSZ01_05060 [Nocardioides szechwanensis]|uniref:Uncharacterized protein n=1 Tax=Nocardioides szechwanensis TaxID=1005944 RepID=A0A1G9W590_9ACTN|nr:hypothetical protein [Nocardioides szechwanensis]GEP32738.1 hypothetical protein NSZ01_05060 [Nocardioides szechwanensis]SDM79660.1 hypothetical protein SAMN05192576_0951 [Nocardioides szechwanensis]
MSLRKGQTATPKVQRPRDDIEAALRRRVKFLRASAAAYDDGDHDEALRMSVDLRALLHYGSSRPLLHELGLIKTLQYVDSAPERPPSSPGTVHMWGGGLTVLEVAFGEGGDTDGSVVPRYATGGPEGPPTNVRHRTYTEWWKTRLVVTAEDGRWFSRSFLVTQMANTEGAHTDAYLDGDYQALQEQVSSWHTSGANGVPKPVSSDVGRASVRQITWELLRTLEESCPELM